MQIVYCTIMQNTCFEAQLKKDYRSKVKHDRHHQTSESVHFILKVNLYWLTRYFEFMYMCLKTISWLWTIKKFIYRRHRGLRETYWAHLSDILQTKRFIGKLEKYPECEGRIHQ